MVRNRGNGSRGRPRGTNRGGGGRGGSNLNTNQAHKNMAKNSNKRQAPRDPSVSSTVRITCISVILCSLSYCYILLIKFNYFCYLNLTNLLVSSDEVPPINLLKIESRKRDRNSIFKCVHVSVILLPLHMVTVYI